MPTASFQSKATTPLDPERVFLALQHEEPWLNIVGVEQIWDVRHRADGRLEGYRFSASAGGSNYQGTAQVFDSHPPRMMEMKLTTSMVEGIIKVAIDGSENGSQVGLSLSLISRGFLAAAAFPIITRSLEANFDEQVRTFVGSL